jgi:hypothetical protein
VLRLLGLKYLARQRRKPLADRARAQAGLGALKRQPPQIADFLPAVLRRPLGEGEPVLRVRIPMRRHIHLRAHRPHFAEYLHSGLLGRRVRGAGGKGGLPGRHPLPAAILA